MMQFYVGDIIRDKLGEKCIICITTNGFVKKNGCAVMGRGIAYQIKNVVPGIDEKLGKLITLNGNVTQIIGQEGKTTIVSFPVKPSSMKIRKEEDLNKIIRGMQNRFSIGDTVPGWACKADLKIIEQSARRLVILTEKYDDYVYLPKPGCGNGELEWSDVLPVISNILKDDKFVICEKS